MHTNSRPLAASLLAILAFSVTACGSSGAGGAHKSEGPSDNAQVAANAQKYMTAWMAEPNPETRCRLETVANRPNYSKDGGALAGCISEYTSNDADKASDTSRAPLSIAINHVQDIKATGKHPAGKGALANLHRKGEAPFRYVLRLVKEKGQWRVEQSESVNRQYAHTADPVAVVLTRTG